MDGRVFSSLARPRVSAHQYSAGSGTWAMEINNGAECECECASECGSVRWPARGPSHRGRSMKTSLSHQVSFLFQINLPTLRSCCSHFPFRLYQPLLSSHFPFLSFFPSRLLASSPSVQRTLVLDNYRTHPFFFHDPNLSLLVVTPSKSSRTPPPPSPPLPSLSLDLTA